MTLDTADIQGIVARGYSRLRAARYTLLRVADAAAAKRWLSTVEVTTADQRGVDQALNLAFTAAGLAALGLAPSILSAFDRNFAAGMTDPTRSRILGDTGVDGAANWSWGGPEQPPVHAVALLFARRDEDLATAQSALSEQLRLAGLEEVLSLDTSDHGDREPFGFHDSISQPLIEGLSKTGPDMNRVKAGEFVLGYRNEYGLYTDRPVVPANTPHSEGLPPDPAGSGGGDLGRNGTYLILRTLRQDVFGFWRFLDQTTRDPAGTSDPVAQVRLGAKIVGRWPSGAPLVLSPERDDPSLGGATDFAYHAFDAKGRRCPIGAHARRSNPRDSLDPDPGSAGSIAVGKRHRLLRRGREYGPKVTPEQLASGADDGIERGLQFVCLCANIGRQFEFIQHTWIGNPKFAGLYEDPDPLVGGHRPGADTFTIQADPVRVRVNSLPQFVNVRGGAYFFLPGIKALRYLAAT